MPAEITDRLLKWYAANARVLPWRVKKKPYATWVSEIMLQQTRVDTVIPYFNRWMQRFPDLETLACAPEQDVLHFWEGLGYYSRARNLHKAIKIVLEKYQGVIPSDRSLLEKLPGIGRYTAGAIASIAFGKDEPLLDGNVRRILARIFNIDLPARSKEAEEKFWELAEAVLPEGKAGDFNQAMMDLGATLCTPRSPQCKSCPVADLCQAQLLGIQEQRPVMQKRPRTPHLTVTAAVIQREGLFLIARRPPNGLLGGLWEFPGGKLETGEELPDCLKREICEELGAQIEVGEPFGVYKHAYTHFRVTLHAFLCALCGNEPQPLEASEIRWVQAEEMPGFPMGKIDRQIADRILLTFLSPNPPEKTASG